MRVSVYVLICVYMQGDEETEECSIATSRRNSRLSAAALDSTQEEEEEGQLELDEEAEELLAESLRQQPGASSTPAR